MKIIQILLSMLLTCLSCLHAQTPVERMNEIKLSSDYIWDEYTHPSVDTATVGATRRLLLYVDIPEDKVVTESDISPFVKYIRMKRTTLNRVFAYIKKTDMDAVLKGTKTKNPQPNRSIQQKQEAKQVQEVKFEPSPLAQQLMSKTDFYAVYSYLEKCKSEGTIDKFGPLKDVKDLHAQHLAIFNQQTTDIVCVLSPIQKDEKRTNLITGKTDSLDNYQKGGYIAIWFSLKQNK